MHQKDSRNIVVLTGAGVSAESGLDTFRDNGGLWEQHRVEDVATPEAFSRNPELVQRFYNMRRSALLEKAKPNAAHFSLAEFEKSYRKAGLGDFLLVTQNVDDLHERGGSEKLLHMHGELLKIRCQQSGKVYPCKEDISADRPCPCCQSPGQLRPDIVWFGEMPMFMDEIEQALLTCDIFVSIGTSGQVYPAAGFVQLAKAYGAHTIELNLEASGGQFDEGHYGPATEVVAEYFKTLLP
ncbi:Sir2 family NAD+-dependent deacetylase [uncultured Pseudoteredinibacter sp.]|uniref:Sir2 family NAD+-dependent deacetylase n=1 Tax=uncultured Pseudoteredinibacter sp. TaxID=1641701 RepID=UPI002605D087|nr:Sir2 family NAD+-dependent deacetylase [uncultured Pseudoteredinibacter sp.]